MLDEAIVSELEKRQTDIRDHLRTLYNLVVDHGYKEVVELGAGQSTYVLLAAVNKTEGDFTSIDLLENARRRGYPEGEGLFNKEIRYHQLIGEDLSFLDYFQEDIDFLFIDSDHDFDHVFRVLELYAPKVRRGGMIAMHDTDHSFGHAVGVKPALEKYLVTVPGVYTVEHIKGCGGLSILTKEKEG